ncbi:MAG TPA: hypothetical protein GXZ60_16395 [Intrasporangiaceae bacterium]|nr:hypothetical protein [Intrasporangiaceae bacterium]
MPEIVTQAAWLLWALVLLIALAKCVEVLSAYPMGSLRLGDWPVHLWMTAGLVAIPAWLWTISPRLVAAIPFAVLGGLLMARSSIRRWRTHELPPVVGYFMLSDPPDGVVNWIKR